jgi:hypothetical protein
MATRQKYWVQYLDERCKPATTNALTRHPDSALARKR